MSSISVAFPIICDYFDVSLIIAGWVLNVNQLVATACMPLGGKAGEVFGVKRAYIFSIVVFIVGSLFSAIAPNIGILIFARLIQSIGTGFFMSLSFAVVSKAFTESRQRAIGFLGSIFPIGSIIGPIIGGWLVESFSWRSVFWFNIPFGLLVLFLSLKLFKAEKGEGGYMDLVGTGYFTGALSTFLIALNTLGNVQNGGSWLVPGALFLAAIGLLVAFLWRESSIKNPLIEPYFLKRAPFLEINIFQLVFGAAALGLMSFVPLFATSIYGMTTLESGLIFTPRAVGTILASMVTSYYLPRWGYRGPMLAGTSIVIISLILLGLEPSGLDILGIKLKAGFLIGIFLFLTGAGTGIVFPAMNNLCVDFMPERVGMIAGLKGMFSQSGSAVSIAVTTLVLDYFPEMRLGFTVVFFGVALILMMTILTIFFMPKSPDDLRWTKTLSAIS